MSNKPKERMLSASRIGTLEKCTWSYWCGYHLKVPQNTHPAASRGTICHLVLEVLLKKRHKKHFNLLIKSETIKSSPAVDRLIIKHLKKRGLFIPEHYEMCDEMIIVGLKADFFGKEFGGKVDVPEMKIELTGKGGLKYKVIGFIDKPLINSKEKKVKIVDYKSSKNKFKGEELSANTQAIIYTMAAKEIWPKMKKFVMEFLFLRYPRKPAQQIEVTDDQIKGYKYYLEHLYKLINNFTEKKARDSYAKDKPGTKWLCGWPGTSWVCPYRDPLKYFVLLDEDGEALQGSFKNDLNPKENQTVEEKYYKGCPAYYTQNQIEGEKGNDFWF
jgi:hypothetical protein